MSWKQGLPSVPPRKACPTFETGQGGAASPPSEWNLSLFFAAGDTWDFQGSASKPSIGLQSYCLECPIPPHPHLPLGTPGATLWSPGRNQSSPSPKDWPSYPPGGKTEWLSTTTPYWKDWPPPNTTCHTPYVAEVDTAPRQVPSTLNMQQSPGWKCEAGFVAPPQRWPAPVPMQDLNLAYLPRDGQCVASSAAPVTPVAGTVYPMSTGPLASESVICLQPLGPTMPPGHDVPAYFVVACPSQPLSDLGAFIPLQADPQPQTQPGLIMLQTRDPFVLQHPPPESRGRAYLQTLAPGEAGPPAALPLLHLHLPPTAAAVGLPHPLPAAKSQAPLDEQMPPNMKSKDSKGPAKQDATMKPSIHGKVKGERECMQLPAGVGWKCVCGGGCVTQCANILIVSRSVVHIKTGREQFYSPNRSSLPSALKRWKGQVTGTDGKMGIMHTGGGRGGGGGY